MRLSFMLMAALYACTAAAQDAATVVPANVIPQPGQVVASGAVPDEAAKADVLARLPDIKVSRVPELLPWNWTPQSALSRKAA